MKELGGAEQRGTVRSRRAGEIEMLLGRVWIGHGTGGRRTGRVGGGKGPQLRRRARPRGQGRCGRRAGSAEGGRLSGWAAGRRLKLPGGGLGRLRTVRMKELGGAEAARHGPEPWAGEIEMLLGRVWIGHSAGGTEDRAGGWRGRAAASAP
jgi:hypothetical protein